nr:hypothetical protein [Stenotrophomonas acidaminiphila]
MLVDQALPPLAAGGAFGPGQLQPPAIAGLQEGGGAVSIAARCGQVDGLVATSPSPAIAAPAGAGRPGIAAARRRRCVRSWPAAATGDRRPAGRRRRGVDRRSMRPGGWLVATSPSPAIAAPAGAGPPGVAAVRCRGALSAGKVLVLGKFSYAASNGACFTAPCWENNVAYVADLKDKSNYLVNSRSSVRFG